MKSDYHVHPVITLKAAYQFVNIFHRLLWIFISEYIEKISPLTSINRLGLYIIRENLSLNIIMASHTEHMNKSAKDLSASKISYSVSCNHRSSGHSPWYNWPKNHILDQGSWFPDIGPVRSEPDKCFGCASQNKRKKITARDCRRLTVLSVI